MLLTPAAEASDWLCIADKATGFRFDNGKWNSVDFAVDDDRFVVSEVTPYDDVIGGRVGVEVTKMGKTSPAHLCPPFGGDQIACGGLGWGFLFNRATLRFQDTYGLGYVDAGDSPDNTPYITIGTCSKLPDR